MYLLWQCSTKKADKDAFPQLTSKAEIFGRKVMKCIPCYYSIWVFKLQSDIQSRHTLNVSMHSSNKRPCIHQQETQGHIQQELSRKNIGFRLVCSTTSTISTKSCTRWFDEKRLCKIWARNQPNFTWDESTSCLIKDKSWFKTMAYILLIEITPLFNYSFIIIIIIIIIIYDLIFLLKDILTSSAITNGIMFFSSLFLLTSGYIFLINCCVLFIQL